MRWLKRAGRGVVVLVLVVVAAWAASRLRGPTPSQRAAFEVMQAPLQFAGRNAFDAIWVLPYDVPDAALSAVADADIAAAAAIPLRRPVDGPGEPRSHYRDLRPVSAGLRPCSSAGTPCLAVVREDLAGHAALVERNRRLIERVEALAQYDHLANRMPARADASVPPFQYLVWPLTAHAVAFAQGHREAALEATCRDLATMRRLGTGTDLLIASSVMSRLATDGYGRLLVDMLGELPQDAPMPDSCVAALRAPSADEASVCSAMRGEFRWVRRATDSMAVEDQGRPMRWLLFDQDGFEAMSAEQLGQACSADTQAALREDRRVAFQTPRPFYLRFECIANSAGCMLADIAAPAYVPYVRGGQDHHARLQLIATLAWLRTQDTAVTLAERLARRPPDLRSPARDITVSADGRSLQIAQYDTRCGDVWSLPLPPYLIESPDAAD